jgi:phytoene dehydrogenase-like protein
VLAASSHPGPSGAAVIGAGPNGIAAAIRLAQAGLSVDLFEAETVPGGGARTLPLTLPGFLHDFGSAVHPMAVGSPFFSSLPLANYGLNWIHSPAAVAHPFDDGSAALLVPNLDEQCRLLGPDGPAWRWLMGPIARDWPTLRQDALGPALQIPAHPFQMARLGVRAVLPAAPLTRLFFKQERTRALFAGLAAHSFLPLTAPLSGVIGLMLGATAYAVGWPIPRGGSQSLTDALLGHFQSLGGRLHTGIHITHLRDLDPSAVVLFDTSPHQLLAIAGDRLSPLYRRKFARYRPGPAAFKLDYALSDPVPWRAPECRTAITVHLGATLDEIAASEAAMASGRIAERPFVLVVQPSLFDPTRAPAGRHTAWVYCHVPNGSQIDMTSRIEAQIERFAPGFRDCVVARSTLSPQRLEAMDPNLLGGDIMGGLSNLTQFVFRPTWRYYATSDPHLYLCSASTPPGGGVHGMCGFHAAEAALRNL